MNVEFVTPAIHGPALTLDTHGFLMTAKRCVIIALMKEVFVCLWIFSKLLHKNSVNANQTHCRGLTNKSALQ